MRKKIIDILPPKRPEEIKVKQNKTSFYSVRPELKKKEEKEEKVLFGLVNPPKSKKFTFKKKAIFLFPVLILIAIFYFSSLSKADIEVWPETDLINLTTKLTIDVEADAYNFTAKVIPGQIFEREKLVSDNFQSSGTFLKEEKAGGIIRVYNEYSTSPQTLVATTRFVSADGKLFRSLERVTIPGGKMEGGKLVPGEFDIEVTADQPGVDYNIGPTTFSIPGFAGSDRYTKFYAKSFKAMEGGSLEQTSRVTEEDLIKAKNNVTERAKTESRDLLEEELKGGKLSLEYIFLEEGIQTEVVEALSMAVAGEEKKEFIYQARAGAKNIIFKKEDFEKFAKDFILSQLPADKDFYEESLTVKKNIENINLASGKIILSLEISGKIYKALDIEDLKQALREKTLMESKIFLESQPQVARVKVELWPFWIKKVPDDFDKINFQLRVD